MAFKRQELNAVMKNILSTKRVKLAATAAAAAAAAAHVTADG